MESGYAEGTAPLHSSVRLDCGSGTGDKAVMCGCSPEFFGDGWQGRLNGELARRPLMAQGRGRGVCRGGGTRKRKRKTAPAAAGAPPHVALLLELVREVTVLPRIG